MNLAQLSCQFKCIYVFYLNILLLAKTKLNYYAFYHEFYDEYF